jgi:hypothetical protein
MQEKVEKLPQGQSGPIDLIIRATETTYTLAYALDGQEKTLAEVPSDCVCEEDINPKEHPFTGTWFGIFNQGVDGEMCESQAHFEYASWTEA